MTRIILDERTLEALSLKPGRRQGQCQTVLPLSIVQMILGRARRQQRSNGHNEWEGWAQTALCKPLAYISSIYVQKSFRKK